MRTETIMTTLTIIMCLIFLLIINAVGGYYHYFVTGKMISMSGDIGSEQLYMTKGYGERDIVLIPDDELSKSLAVALGEETTVTLKSYLNDDVLINDTIRCDNIRIKYVGLLIKQLDGTTFTCKKVGIDG